MSHYTALGNRIREARRAKGWSQDRLADELNQHTYGGLHASRRGIIRWEKGDHRPSREYRELLERLLGVTDFTADPEKLSRAQQRAAEIAAERNRLRQRPAA